MSKHVEIDAVLAGESDGCIVCGDCLEVMAEMPDGRVDAVVTDTPYGTTACSWDSVIPLDTMWRGLTRAGAEHAIFAFTASQPFTAILTCSNLPMFRHEWIWLKNRGSNFANTAREPMKEHESVLVFSRGGWTYNRQMQPRAESGKARSKYQIKHNAQDRETYRKFEGREHHDMDELRVPSSCQTFNVVAGSEKTKHPTQKPLALLEYLLRTYTNEGDVVLDPTCGSGTTCVAAKQLGRRWIGIEIDEGYCKIARERVRTTTPPLFT